MHEKTESGVRLSIRLLHGLYSGCLRIENGHEKKCRFYYFVNFGIWRRTFFAITTSLRSVIYKKSYEKVR